MDVYESVEGSQILNGHRRYGQSLGLALQMSKMKNSPALSPISLG